MAGATITEEEVQFNGTLDTIVRTTLTPPGLYNALVEPDKDKFLNY